MIGGEIDPTARAEREVRGLFADDEAVDRGVSWARQVLADAGIDPETQPMQAIRVLRRTERGLSLIAARYLVSAAAGRPPRRRGPGSPVLR
ncbi:hypothetical protein [Brachybacterium fresconis]|uniref:Uncharacterized protein n=1 Tax=Brachybacterium fresconis TaxID=173363 RepID=A0ABS4YEC9_9MICO|nr:hypothetical protein [Brachybacterium fresconis]MBP2407154.1 hypothetical protein [Brachybacterium fresconis]